MVARLENEDGKMNIYMNNIPTPPILFALSDFPAAASNTHYAFKNIQNFKSQGINIVSADSDLNVGWHKVSPFDTEAITSEIESVLDANPDAKVLLRLHLNPPYWWLRDNPEECIVYRTEEGDFSGIDDGEQDRLIKNDDKMHLRASIASEKWICEASENLTLLLEKLKGTRARSGLVAIQLAYGMFGEWHAFGRSIADVSEPMKAHFKEYLKNKYKTKASLRKAWKDEDVDFETAEYHPEKFQPVDDGAFRDPSRSVRVIDSQMSNQTAVTDAILRFARVVKSTDPELLCGTFYGYYLCTADTAVIGAHLNPTPIYESSDIDFICGPFCYMDNRLPDGVPMQRAFLESHRLHGKLWLTEMDQFPLGVEEVSGGTKENFDTNVAVLRVNALQPIFGGHGFWYYDHRLVPSLEIMKKMGAVVGDVSSIYRKRGWWDSPEMMNEIGKIQEFAGEFIKRKYTTDADVLIVYDEEAKYYHTVSDSDSVEYKLFSEFATCGVAYDCIYLSDLELCQIKKYKCIIFADCPNIDAKKQTLIDKIRENITCVFLHGFGYSDGKHLSCKASSRACGVEIRRTEANYISSDFFDRVALDSNIAPAFCITDKSAEPLAYFDNGTVAAAKKNNCVYISMNYIPGGLAKRIFRDSGVHIWCDSGDSIIAASGCVLIKCHNSGVRNLKLPGGGEIQIISEGVETRVYEVKTQKRLL